jgi:hypothetical protein
MVDLDDEYDVDANGDGPRWSPDKQREWERNESERGPIDSIGNMDSGREREPLGETTEPSSLYRTDAPDDGFHYDRQPSEPSQVRC